MNTASEPAFAAPAQLSDDVARFVRRRIFNGTFPAGEYLRLDQLATELGVSVTPVREALLNLRAEGLLVLHPRRGFMVLEVTARDVSDVAMVQAFVGGELAAQHTDVDHMVRLNHEFHRLINVVADSPKLTQFMSGITRYAPEAVFPTLAGWPDLSIRDHRRVITALKDGDAEAARAAMAEHFTVGVEPLTDHLTERGVIRDGS
jgi:DNA-binding GntR family transcriptional regulator